MSQDILQQIMEDLVLIFKGRNSAKHVSWHWYSQMLVFLQWVKKKATMPEFFRELHLTVRSISTVSFQSVR